MSSTPAPPAAPWPTAPPGAPGVKSGFPEVPGMTHPRSRFTGRYPMVALLVAGLAVLSLLLVLVVVLARPSPPAPCNPITCQHPPIRTHGVTGAQTIAGPVLDGEHVYKNAQGFSLRYPPSVPGGNVKVATGAAGILLTFPVPGADGGPSYLEVKGGAWSSDAVTLVEDYVNNNFPGATGAYVIPGAWVGFTPGFGVALNYVPNSSSSSTQTDRVMVLGAVQQGFAILVVAAGPLLPPVSNSNYWWDGHPSPADLSAAYIADQNDIVNSISFP